MTPLIWNSVILMYLLGFSLAFTWGGHAPSQMITGPAFASPRYFADREVTTGRVTKLTRRLFSFQLNENGKSNKDNDDDNVEDEPDWVKSLLKWRIQPNSSKVVQMPPPSIEEEREDLARESGETSPKRSTAARRAPVPLASLINVEALLMASGEDVLDEVGDIGFFSILTNNNRSSNVVSSAADKKPDTKESAATAATPLTILPKLEEQGDWNKLIASLQLSVKERSSSDGGVLASAAESILKEATTRMENFLNETASVVSPATVEHLIMRASNALALEESAGGIKAAADGIVKVAEELAREQGLNVTEAADRARATTKYTAELVRIANGVLVSGYVRDDGEGLSRETLGREISLVGTEFLTDVQPTRPLFDDFETARAIPSNDYNQAVTKSAEMASLSGAIYQDTLPQCHKIGHSLVANGTSGDVSWMVTDSIGYEDDYRSTHKTRGIERPFLVRTITLRGFDASDDNVDRERLLQRIITAKGVDLGGKGIKVHMGLLSIARKLYNDVVPYIDMAAPTHKIVLNGHSIGGSLSVLLLMLLTEKRGVDFVLENILRVFTFGSPPISISAKAFSGAGQDSSCSTLEALGLHSDLVFQYIQPWDPVVRLFSEIDPCYPLIEDIGEDGNTLYASGPSRALRPITRAIIESWEGWPQFRDNWHASSNQNFTGVGVQYLLLPEPTRYLADRLVSANIAIPPVDTVIQISSRELIPALRQTYPLDVFSISFVPAALRSFVHHFYPAYGSPFVEFANREKKMKLQEEETTDARLDDRSRGGTNDRVSVGIESFALDEKVNGATKVEQKKGQGVIDWAEVSAQWILGGKGDDKQ